MPVKNKPKTLMRVNRTASAKVSPVNPEAKTFTIGCVKARTKKAIVAASKRRALLKLLVYLSASDLPFTLKMRLYMGMKPVAMPALTNENTTVGIVWDIR
jgi:hypothetical protein